MEHRRLRIEVCHWKQTLVPTATTTTTTMLLFFLRTVAPYSTFLHFECSLSTYKLVLHYVFTIG